MPHHHAIIRHAIDTVRSRVRFALAGETAARTAVAVGLFLWGWLLFDWLLEPPAWARAGVLIAAAGFLGRWLWRHSLSALLTPLPDNVIAAWIERRWPELGESLLTALSEDVTDPDPAHHALVLAARKRAEQVLRSHEEPEVVDTRRLRPWFWGASAVLLSLLLGMALRPDAAGVYLRRLALSEELWPRRVVLTAERFVLDDRGRLVWRVPRDAPLEVKVRAELTNGHEAPDVVAAYLRQVGGARIRRQFAAIGAPTAGPDAHQAYSLKLDRLRQDVELRVRGGDGRLGPLLIQVTPRPTVVSARLQVAPPAYSGRRTYQVDADALDLAPEGAVITLAARCNKRLRRVAATYVQGESSERLPATIGGDAVSFELQSPPLATGGVIELTLLDQDGIESLPPYRLPVRLKQDEPPRIEFVADGVGRFITPDAVIPTTSTIEDDHGVASSTLHLAIESREVDLPLASQSTTDSFSVDTAIDLLSLRSDPAVQLVRLEPGAKLQLQVTAEDRYCSPSDPQAGPHRSSSQVESFTIVTPEDLVARLEEREVNLRRTFEQTYDEARGAQLNAQRIDADGESGGDAEQAVRRRRLAVSRLAEQVGKLTNDVGGVAEGFERILAELVNNRIQNDELKERIDLQIVRPLRQLSSDRIPDLLRQVEARLDSLGDDPSTRAVPPATIELLDQVVVEMESALKEMKAVETYNEVLALLRGIIDDQRDLSKRTGDARKSSLKRLLLD